MDKSIFVFGSNCSGYHGAGAAKYAHKMKGAQWGMGYGHHGESFAIPTMERDAQTRTFHKLSLEFIEYFVNGFLAYAYTLPDLTFQVSRIGCGLAGYKDSDIAPIFEGAPDNCMFDEQWEPWLKGYSYFSFKG